MAASIVIANIKTYEMCVPAAKNCCYYISLLSQMCQDMRNKIRHTNLEKNPLSQDAFMNRVKMVSAISIRLWLLRIIWPFTSASHVPFLHAMSVSTDKFATMS